MAYADFDATEARGMWSPPDRSAPAMLPDYWRASSEDEIRTDIPDLTDDELNALGFVKVDNVTTEQFAPYEYTHTLVWDSSSRSYTFVEITDEDEKKFNVQYIKFWEGLLETDVYARMKTEASSSLPANTLLTEFISLLNDAKSYQLYNYDKINESRIQASISAIVSGLSLTSTEITELQTLFNSTGMGAVYTLS